MSLTQEQRLNLTREAELWEQKAEAQEKGKKRLQAIRSRERAREIRERLIRDE